MKKGFLALLLVVGLSFAVTLPAAATPVGNEQPACGDITFGDGFYHVLAPPENSVEGSILLAAPSCKDVSYTYYVTYLSGGNEKTKSQKIHGDGVSDFLQFSITNVISDTGTVCVYFESAKGSNIIDRAPDSGCVTLLADTAPGGSSQFT